MPGVPSNLILPFVGVYFDSSRAQAGSSNMPVSLLVIGQMTSGTGTAETLTLCNNAADVGVKFGLGSQIHRMAKYIFSANTTVPVYFIALADADGTQATSVWTYSGPATANGEEVVYVAGTRYAVAVADEDTATVVGDAVAAAINADTESQVTAVNAAGEITLTVRNDGVAASDLDVRFNYNAGEEHPTGITVSAVVLTDGTVDPDIADALAAVGDQWCNVIVHPYNDATNLGVLETWLATQAGVTISKDSLAYCAKRDTQANLITFAGTSRNSQYIAMNGLHPTGELESTYEYAATIAALSASSMMEDPAVPLHRMTLTGHKVATPSTRWTLTERNQLALAGVSTLTHTNGVQTESTVTMYLTNVGGAPDTAYQQQNTIFQLMLARWSFINRILTRYPRAKLATNAEGLREGQQIMTVEIGRSEAVAWFLENQREGNFEGGTDVLDQFIAELHVARDDTNVNRMNWLLPPDMMNQFIIGSGILQFRG